MSKMNIMKKVDILDLINIEISVDAMGHLHVDFVSLDMAKQVIIDTQAMEVLNKTLTEKVVGKSPKDPNVIGYVKEFVGKMVSELYRNGLILLEDIPEAHDDPYYGLGIKDKDVRKLN